MIKVLPPEEAMRKARANVAAWKREKEIARLKQGPETPESPGGTGLSEPIRKPLKTPRREKLDRNLFNAVKERRIDEMLDLLSKGADPNAKHGDLEQTTLFVTESPHVMRILIEHGADPDAKDRGGQTPLMIVVKKSNGRQLTKILLEAGADIQAKDSSGVTAMGYVDPYSGSVELLVEAGMDPFEKDDAGRTMLSWHGPTDRAEFERILERLGIAQNK